MPINVLVVTGSLQSGAYSSQTARAVQRELVRQKAALHSVSLSHFPLPLFDQDLQDKANIPESAFRLATLFVESDAVVISTPEYNASLPALLKNALDWMSFIPKAVLSPFAGKVTGICSSSSGAFGGIRANDHLRTVLLSLQMQVIVPGLIVPNAAKAFDKEDDFCEQPLQKALCRFVSILIEDAVLHSPGLSH